MIILLVLVLLGLLFVTGFIVFTLIEEKRDETWGVSDPLHTEDVYVPSRHSCVEEDVLVGCYLLARGE